MLLAFLSESSLNLLWPFLQTSHGLCLKDPSPKSKAWDVLCLLLSLFSVLTSRSSAHTTSAVDTSLTPQAFLSPHSTTLTPFLSTAFILLWAMVCSVGAYLHLQIVSFLKSVHSIAPDNLLGAKHMSVQVCWKEARNIPLGNKPLGEASHTRGDFHKGLIIWKDVESDVITAAAKTNTKTRWTHIRICI